jgi:hypothetical protein
MKELYTLPPATSAGTWEWLDPEWRLDVSWTTSKSKVAIGDDEDDHLDISRGGWEYSDKEWKDPRSSPGLTSLTRRRLWVRSMVFKPSVVLGGVAKVANVVTGSGGGKPKAI